MVVERPELEEVAVGLLEVVAEDLLVLDRALAVHAVGPLDELLVEGRAGALQHAVVRRVADEDVMEAERVLLDRSRPVGLHELLVRERGQVRSDRGADAFDGQVPDGVLGRRAGR